MLLLFLCLDLGTPSVHSQGQGVKVTCDSPSVSEDQQLVLRCTVDYTAIQTPNQGTEGTANDPTCVTERFTWKNSNIVLRSCEQDNCNKKTCEASPHTREDTDSNTIQHYCYEKKSATKADEGIYTFSIGTNCGDNSGTTSWFSDAVTARKEGNQPTQQAPVWLALVVIISIITVLAVLLFLITSHSGRRLMDRLKSYMTQSNRNNTDESPEGTREALTLVSA
ncbi:hypothetical protein J4Q44_G00278780 [Coregonus suidteri]|uniref:Uncharacterized protein n=1 Tax=Coregonus suidteri TaxID=861788 RepID=A0AAN8LA02_9TELE